MFTHMKVSHEGEFRFEYFTFFDRMSIHWSALASVIYSWEFISVLKHEDIEAILFPKEKNKHY